MSKRQGSIEITEEIVSLVSRMVWKYEEDTGEGTTSFSRRLLASIALGKEIPLQSDE